MRHVEGERGMHGAGRAGPGSPPSTGTRPTDRTPAMVVHLVSFVELREDADQPQRQPFCCGRFGERFTGADEFEHGGELLSVGVV